MDSFLKSHGFSQIFDPPQIPEVRELRYVLRRLRGNAWRWRRALRQKNQNSQNEPGMCPGISSFTFGVSLRHRRLGATVSWRVNAYVAAFAMCASQADRQVGNA